MKPASGRWLRIRPRRKPSKAKRLKTSWPACCNTTPRWPTPKTLRRCWPAMHAKPGTGWNTPAWWPPSSSTRCKKVLNPRSKALFAPSKQVLVERLERYLDAGISWADHKASSDTILIDDYVDFSAQAVRQKALLTLIFSEASVHPYAVRPFDNQYCYWSELRPLWRRHRPDFAVQVKAKQSRSFS